MSKNEYDGEVAAGLSLSELLEESNQQAQHWFAKSMSLCNCRWPKHDLHWRGVPPWCVERKRTARRDTRTGAGAGARSTPGTDRDEQVPRRPRWRCATPGWLQRLSPHRGARTRRRGGARQGDWTAPMRATASEPRTKAGKALVEWGREVAVRGTRQADSIADATVGRMGRWNSDLLRAWVVKIESEVASVEPGIPPLPPANPSLLSDIEEKPDHDHRGGVLHCPVCTGRKP